MRDLVYRTEEAAEKSSANMRLAAFCVAVQCVAVTAQVIVVLVMR